MKQPSHSFAFFLRKFFQFYKREVKQFNAILGIKPGNSSHKC